MDRSTKRVDKVRSMSQQRTGSSRSKAGSSSASSWAIDSAKSRPTGSASSASHAGGKGKLTVKGTSASGANREGKTTKTLVPRKSSAMMTRKSHGTVEQVSTPVGKERI